MVNSINTNPGAAAGLQQVHKTSTFLEKTQERIATGKKVNSPKDDAAIYAIAQQLTGDLAGAAAVRGNLAFGEAATSVATTAGTAISDLLIEAKGKAVQAAQPGLDAASSQALQNDFAQITAQIDSIAQAASFGSTNLVKPGSQNLDVVAGENGEKVTVQAADLTSNGLGISGASLATPAQAQNAVTSIDTALKSANSAVANFGTAAKSIETKTTLNTQMSDTLKQGIGKLVDADLGQESAKLLAGQVRQRLGIQSLSIANSAPRNIASLFE